MLKAVVRTDLAEFWAVAEDYFRADPVWHTVPVAAVDRRLRFPEADDPRPVLASLHEDDEVRRAAVHMPPWPLAASGIPVEAADLVASTLQPMVPELTGVSGPRPEAEAFARAWVSRTGGDVRETMSMRLYRLGDLLWPDVPGKPRLAGEADIARLAGWRGEFVEDAVPGTDPGPSAEAAVRRRSPRGRAR